MNDRIKLAVVFPGQGSQSLGMIDSRLIEADNDVKKIFDIA